MIVVQYIRSLIFIGAMYLAMAVIGLIYLPSAMLLKDGALRACHDYCRWVRWSARWMVGLETEIRGTPPTDEVLVAAKHQSFLDIILIFSAVPRGKFIMKSLLKYAPILGWFALKIGCVPVDRGKRSQAIKKMLADVKTGRAEPGQLIIYPQGTRVAPGAVLPYKVGSAALYTETGQDCVPVATNVGVFWPRHGLLRKPGLAVVEFLPRIETGLGAKAFLAQLEPAIENASDALMKEAGFDVPPKPLPGEVPGPPV